MARQVLAPDRSDYLLPHTLPAYSRKSYTHECLAYRETFVPGTIGVSEYAAKALGDVVYVELPQVQDELSAGDTLGAVESVKSASDIMTPVGGTVLETNQLLGDVPGTINKSPEGDGWIAKMKLSNPAEVDKLMDADQYANHTGEQELKDE